MAEPIVTTRTVRAGWVLYAVETLGWTWGEAKTAFDVWIKGLETQPSEPDDPTS